MSFELKRDYIAKVSYNLLCELRYNGFAGNNFKSGIETKRLSKVTSKNLEVLL
ncbi:unnamed protein product [Blumeria hordei]|uniref:Uncharacterized protein n=2 Tax=Blumeria hordei TaxID=2867405 RepID=A0A383UHT2_BLUHO|nr:putative Bgh-specific peptide [Blumeria hordei DH14]SZE99381.1 unnamed protein product [Blumeria hordei]